MSVIAIVWVNIYYQSKLQNIETISIFWDIKAFFEDYSLRLQCFLLTLLNKKIMENRDLNRLKVVLAEKKITNKWIAEQLGKDQGTVSKWCTNTCQPVLASLMKIAELLNVDLNELVRFEHKPQTSNSYTK